MQTNWKAQNGTSNQNWHVDCDFQTFHNITLPTQCQRITNCQSHAVFSLTGCCLLGFSYVIDEIIPVYLN